MTAIRRRRRLRVAVAHVDPTLPTIDQTLEVYKQQKFWLRNVPLRRVVKWRRQLEARGSLSRFETAQLGAMKWVLAKGESPFPTEVEETKK